MAGTEKRRGKRIAYNADIIFSVFNRKKHFTPYFNAYYDAFHRAHMHNCSAEGMFFDSDFELKPHSQLLLKVTDGKSDIFTARNRDQVCQAKVIWSQRKSNCRERCFRTGVLFTDADRK